jgi:phage anti-repressor protein
MNEISMINRLDSMAQSAAQYPVDFDEAWQWVGYSRKDAGLEMLKNNFIANKDFCSSENRSKAGRGGHNEMKYLLTARCFEAFCMMAGTDKGREVREYFLDLQDKYRDMVESTRVRKLVRREFTEAIRESGLNEAMHGWAYKCFTDLIYKAVTGMTAKQLRKEYGFAADANCRECITPLQASAVTKLEKLAGDLVDMGADYDSVKTVIALMGAGVTTPETALLGAEASA